MEANRQPFFKIVKKKLFIKIVILKHSSDCKKTTRALFPRTLSYLNLLVDHLNWPISKILELQIIQVRFLVLIYKVAQFFHGFTNLFHQSVKATNSSSKQIYQECACMSVWKSRIQSNFVVGHVTSPSITHVIINYTARAIVFLTETNFEL